MSGTQEVLSEMGFCIQLTFIPQGLGSALALGCDQEPTAGLWATAAQPPSDRWGCRRSKGPCEQQRTTI